MKIGLIDVDSKIPNLALMKLSAYHKKRGDTVKWWNAFENFDKVYASKIFTKTHYHYFPKNTIRGGSGIDLLNNLPNHIEHVYPDYSLYNLDYAMGFVTRGCINRCPFCIVWRKEGLLRYNAPIEEFRNNQTNLMLLDNSITDCKKAIKELEKIRDLGIKLNLTQGFNVRTIKLETAKILAKIKLWKGKQWHIAWDNIKDEQKVFQGIKILNQAGIKNWKIMCYVLVNYNSSFKQDYYRIQTLEKKGIDPFVMIYRENPISPKTQALARWCNRKPLMKSCSFEKYYVSKTQKSVMILEEDGA